MRRGSPVTALLLALGGIGLIGCGLLAIGTRLYFNVPQTGMGNWNFTIVAIGVIMLLVGIMGGWVKLL